MNDINAACASASIVQNQSFAKRESIDERLAKLILLKGKDLINDQEYEMRRQRILDEI